MVTGHRKRAPTVVRAITFCTMRLSHHHSNTDVSPGTRVSISLYALRSQASRAGTTRDIRSWPTGVVSACTIAAGIGASHSSFRRWRTCAASAIRSPPLGPREVERGCRCTTASPCDRADTASCCGNRARAASEGSSCAASLLSPAASIHNASASSTQAIQPAREMAIAPCIPTRLQRLACEELGALPGEPARLTDGRRKCAPLGSRESMASRNAIARCPPIPRTR
eukprot:scaffold142705_cov27-Tisochrysis_lutea.AAC.4